MDNHTPQRLAHSSSGHDNHGVHVCHQCGWAFPNPHPSAKHRRAHKRVCGTIEGYKLSGVDLEGSSHSNLSDDDRLSDGDRKTPSSEVLEVSGAKKGSGGPGELTKRSEDEVFSDAATEFLVSGIGAGVIEEKVSRKESDAIRSIECGPVVAEAVKPPGSSTESIQVQHLKTPASTIDTLGNALESSCPTENLALLHKTDGSASVDDFKPTISEMQKDASCEKENTGEVDAVFDSHSTSNKQGTEAEGNKETYSDITSPDIHILPSKAAGEFPDAVEPLPSIPDEDSINLKIPETDVSPAVKYVEPANAVTNITEGKSRANSDEFTEDKGEANSTVHVLSVSDDLQETNSAKVMLEGFKDYKVYPNQAAPSEFELAKEIDDAEGLVSRSNHSEGTAVSASGSHVLVKEVPVEEESSLSQIDSKVNENQGYDDETVATVAVAMLDQESNDVLSEQLQGNCSEGTKDATSGADTASASGNHGKAVNSDISGDCSSKGAIEGNFTESSVSASDIAISASGVQVGQSTDKRVRDDAGSYEKVEVETVNTTGDTCVDVSNHLKSESGVGNDNGQAKKSVPAIVPESAKFSEFESGQEVMSQGVADYEKVDIEKHKITGDVKDEITVDGIHSSLKEGFLENLVVTESVDKLLEPSVDHATKTKKDLPVEQIMTSESASHPQESHTVAEDVVLGSIEMLPESACTDSVGAMDSRSVGVDTVLDTKQGATENEADAHDEVREVIPSLHSEDMDGKEIDVSSLDSKSPIQSTDTTEDNSARGLMNVVPGVGSESFPGESDRQQVGGSVLDIAADSSSQTDSLENNWGSMSVLSVQSDAQAVLDAEITPPTESRAATGEKTGSKKSRPSYDGQNSDKSDIFEPPSFMTLVVEPGAKNGQNSTASEMEASSQIPHQPNASSALQAGWFPSITHVANESLGRKKNEEIIAKVTNWRAGKQHTPLKNLLGEASQDNNTARAKSPRRKDNLAPEAPATTVNSILAPELPLAQAVDREMGKEWNSPARYPAEIKREKRKPKSRPYWAQFMCCSSVH